MSLKRGSISDFGLNKENHEWVIRTEYDHHSKVGQSGKAYLITCEYMVLFLNNKLIVNDKVMLSSYIQPLVVQTKYNTHVAHDIGAIL